MNSDSQIIFGRYGCAAGSADDQLKFYVNINGAALGMFNSVEHGAHRVLSETAGRLANGDERGNSTISLLGFGGLQTLRRRRRI